MSDFHNSIEYFSNRAKSASNRGSTVELEEQLQHIESLLEHYLERALPQEDVSLVGEFTNFYREVYQSSSESPISESAEIVHRYLWRAILSAWEYNHVRALDESLSIAIDQYLFEIYSDSPNDAVIEKAQRNYRPLLRYNIGEIEEASDLADINFMEVRFDRLFSQVRRIVREAPKRGLVEPVESFLNMISNIYLNPHRFGREVDDIKFNLQRARNSGERDNQRLKENLSFAARKHRLALKIEEEIENLCFVGSAWVTNLRLQEVIDPEKFDYFTENLINDYYSNPSDVAEQFFQVAPSHERYWEMWELQRRMDDSPDEIVSAGSAAWGWLLEFYCIQMVRLFVETGRIETDIADQNPIPLEEILRVRSDDILNKIDELNERGVFREVLPSWISDSELQAATEKLSEAHEQLKEEANDQWIETIRETTIDEKRKSRFEDNLAGEVLEKFEIRKVFEYFGWINSGEEVSNMEIIQTESLGHGVYPKRVFVDDPFVGQTVHTSQFSSKLAAKATILLISEFDAVETNLPEGRSLPEFLIEQGMGQEVACYLVNIGDDRRDIIDSEYFKYPSSEDVGGRLSGLNVAGYLEDVPVVTTRLEEAKAVIVASESKTLYEPSGANPIDAELIPGDVWAQDHPDQVSEEVDPELYTVLEVEYQFGVSGEGLTIVR